MLTFFSSVRGVCLGPGGGGVNGLCLAPLGDGEGVGPPLGLPIKMPWKRAPKGGWCAKEPSQICKSNLRKKVAWGSMLKMVFYVWHLLCKGVSLGEVTLCSDSGNASL